MKKKKRFKRALTEMMMTVTMLITVMSPIMVSCKGEAEPSKSCYIWECKTDGMTICLKLYVDEKADEKVRDILINGRYR